MCKSIKNVFLNLVTRFFHNLIYSINPPWVQCTLNSTRTVLLKNRNTVEHTWRAIKATVVFSSMFCLIQFDCIVDLLQTVFLFWPSNISFWQISKCSYFVTNSKDNYTREKTPKATCHNRGKIPNVILHIEWFIVKLFSSSMTKIDVLIRDSWSSSRFP